MIYGLLHVGDKDKKNKVYFVLIFSSEEGRGLACCSHWPLTWNTPFALLLPSFLVFRPDEVAQYQH